jgi:isoquinoline 1-oxidoreductase beta subunit
MRFATFTMSDDPHERVGVCTPDVPFVASMSTTRPSGDEVPNFEVGYVMRNTPVPVGFWRGVNHSQNGYFRESFVDELAHSRGQDLYLFRRGLLSKGPRSLAVLDEAARRARWGHAPKGISQGIALVECYNSVTAQVADISVGETGELAVHRVICAMNAGYIVNPSIVDAQVEGAVVYGLGAVLYGQITLREGQVQQPNFHDYRALRMNEMPRVETYFLSSGNRYSQEWGGVGEPGTPPLARAIANAVSAATGQRIRALPPANHKIKRNDSQWGARRCRRPLSSSTAGEFKSMRSLTRLCSGSSANN